MNHACAVAEDKYMHEIILGVGMVIVAIEVALSGFIAGRIYERDKGIYRKAYDALNSAVVSFFALTDMMRKLHGVTRSQEEIDALERIKNGGIKHE